MKKILLMMTCIAVLASCTVVRQGEVGVKRKLGTYDDTPYTEGLRTYNPFTSTIVKVPVQTENMEVSLALPSKEGLNIRAAISILYNINPQRAPEVLRNIGLNYEQNVILPVFRSAIADVTAKFYAKDMHTGQRSVIEEAIRERMAGILEDRGINVEAVLIKSIQLPENLSRAIEEKLEAEQRALRMEFVLQEAEQEAQRKRLEAEGIRDAQNIISQGLDPLVLQFKSIEAFLTLAQSPNTKVIITDGDMPVLMGPELEGTNTSNQIRQ